MAYFDLDPLLETMLDAAPGISDLNLSVGRPPQVEVDGQLRPVAYAGIERLLPYQTELIAMRLLAGKRDLADKLVRTGSVDLSYSLARRTRFRVNVFAQRGSYSIVLRVIPNKVPTVEELGMPAAAQRDRATSATASCWSRAPPAPASPPPWPPSSTRSTATRPSTSSRSRTRSSTCTRTSMATINQREVGADTQTFALALRAALRQAPKVILVGEMRDVETISIALEASETGHLVLSTLHTIDAAKTIDRIVGVFPKNEERQIRTRFSQAFKWVVSQRLVPKQGGGRMAVCEILRSTSRTQGVRAGGRARGQEPDRRHGGRRARGHADLRPRAGAADQRGRASTARSALSYATNRTNLAARLETQGAERHRRTCRPSRASGPRRSPRPAPAPAPRPRPRLRRPDREVARAGQLPQLRAADRRSTTPRCRTAPSACKCPKCQTIVQVPGQGRGRRRAAGAAARADAGAGARGAGPARGARPRSMRRADDGASSGASWPARSDRGQRAARWSRWPTAPWPARSPCRSRGIGYQVDTSTTRTRAARLLEQGVYDVVVTTRAAPAAGQRELYQRIEPPQPRRAAADLPGPGGRRVQDRRRHPGLRDQADLVVNPRDGARRTPSCSTPWPSAPACTRCSSTRGSASRRRPRRTAAVSLALLAAAGR